MGLVKTYLILLCRQGLEIRYGSFHIEVRLCSAVECMTIHAHIVGLACCGSDGKALAMPVLKRGTLACRHFIHIILLILPVVYIRIL